MKQARRLSQKRFEIKDMKRFKSMSVNEEQKYKSNRYLIGLSILIFIGLFAFFYVAYPIYIYDSDDWTYVSYSRQALPSVNQWNPTKILPETLMPLVSEIGVRLVYPITGDYIKSLAMVFAITISLIITIYFILSIKRIKDSFEIKSASICIIGGAFILFHFLPFSVSEINNRFLFYGGNANCYFNYIIPGLCNVICVLIFLRDDIDSYKFSKECIIHSGWLILLVYLCINSNMFHSIILISFFGSECLIELIRSIKDKKKIIMCLYSMVKTKRYELLVILAWLVSIIIESQGARAQWAAGTTLKNLPVVYCFKLFLKSITELNIVWLLSSIIIVLAAFVLYLFTKENKTTIDENYFGNIRKMFLAQSITIVYLILLCSKVSSEYIQNNTVMFSWMIWSMLIVLFSLSYFIRKWKYLDLLLPLTLYLLVFNTVIDGKKYADNNVVWNYGVNTVKEIDDYIIEEIRKADKVRAGYVDVKVPVTDSLYWPLDASYAGDRIASTLFVHGIIENKVHVVLVPDNTMNERFGVGTATMP